MGEHTGRVTSTARVKRSLMVAELLSQPKHQSPPVPAPVPSFSSAS